MLIVIVIVMIAIDVPCPIHVLFFLFLFLFRVPRVAIGFLFLFLFLFRVPRVPIGFLFLIVGVRYLIVWNPFQAGLNAGQVASLILRDGTAGAVVRAGAGRGRGAARLEAAAQGPTPGRAAR